MSGKERHRERRELNRGGESEGLEMKIEERVREKEEKYMQREGKRRWKERRELDRKREKI